MWKRKLFNHGFGVHQVVRIAVVERDAHAAGGETSAGEAPHQIAEGNARAFPGEHSHVVAKVAGRHGQIPRIRLHVGDAMVEQNDRRDRLAFGTASAPFAVRRRANRPVAALECVASGVERLPVKGRVE